MDDLYKESARILRELDAKRDSFRNLIFQSGYKNKKQLYKICIETMKRKTTLDEMIAKFPVLIEQINGDSYLVSVLLYEYLYGITCLRRCRNRHWKKAMQENEEELKRMKNQFDSDIHNGQNDDGKCNEQTEHRIPRYARVNTLKCQLDEVVACLEEEGCVKVDVEDGHSKAYRNRIRSLDWSEFCVDPLVPDLLVFAPGTDLHAHYLITDGRLVLQDKSSCLSAFCLNPEPDSVVLDICAAPGMKTSHLAALMENRGGIYAVDKDEGRVETMRTLLAQKDVSCVEIMCQDFLAIDLNTKKFRKITHALLDPPCSGSGIVNRGDAWMDLSDPSRHTADERRLNSLGNLQAMMLKRVFTSNLPNLKRVVYSTCSIYERENEMVIEEALETASSAGFKLVNALENWKHRGLKKFPFGNLCLRASPKSDATNGFFVAVFDR